MDDYLERSKKFWVSASDFPLDKEKVYPQHSEVQEFDHHTGKVILEYGCGAGSDTLSYLRRGNIVHFCDIVPENIETTRKNVDTAGFAVSAIPHLLDDSVSFPSSLYGAIDIISSHGVLHHIMDPHPVMDQFYELLKPCGLLYIMLYTEVAGNYFEATINQLVKEHHISREEAFGWCMDTKAPYARPYTEAEGWDLLDSHGFKLMKATLFANNFFRTYKSVKI